MIVADEGMEKSEKHLNFAPEFKGNQMANKQKGWNKSALQTFGYTNLDAG